MVARKKNVGQLCSQVFVLFGVCNLDKVNFDVYYNETGTFL